MNPTGICRTLMIDEEIRTCHCKIEKGEKKSENLAKLRQFSCQHENNCLFLFTELGGKSNGRSCFRFGLELIEKKAFCTLEI